MNHKGKAIAMCRRPLSGELVPWGGRHFVMLMVIGSNPTY